MGRARAAHAGGSPAIHAFDPWPTSAPCLRKKYALQARFLSALQYTEHPILSNTVLLAAWGGWPDAAESATRSLRELVRQFSATNFASIDPEEFYDFAEQRPVISNGPDGSRKLTWPKNEFFYWKADDGGHDLLIFNVV